MENEIKYLREINELAYRLGLAIGCLEIVEGIVRDQVSSEDADRIMRVLEKITPPYPELQ